MLEFLNLYIPEGFTCLDAPYAQIKTIRRLNFNRNLSMTNWRIKRIRHAAGVDEFVQWNVYYYDDNARQEFNPDGSVNENYRYRDNYSDSENVVAHDYDDTSTGIPYSHDLSAYYHSDGHPLRRRK